MRATSRLRGTSILTLVFAALMLAQAVQQKGTLTVRGFAGRAPVVQVNGKSYVELESLARLTNGSLTFRANEVTLTLNAPPVAAETAPAEPPKLSKDTLRAGVEAMAAIGEWRQAVASAVQNSSPLTEDWADGYRRIIQSNLTLAASAGLSDDDRNVVQLMRNEFDNMQKLSDRYVAMRKSLSYIDPASLDNDSLNQQVQSCAQGLTSMAASGHFQDVAACH